MNDWWRDEYILTIYLLNRLVVMISAEESNTVGNVAIAKQAQFQACIISSLSSYNVDGKLQDKKEIIYLS